MEGCTDSPPSKKKRKLTFSQELCCFCKKRFQSNRTVLDAKKCDSLLNIAKTRNDELSVNIVANEISIRKGELTVCYHKACRSKFMHPFYKQNPENESAETLTQNFTRSQKDTFDWKSHCFICGKICSAKHRYKWSRVEGSTDENSKLVATLLEVSEAKHDHVLHTRILGCKGDLVAVEARYHRKKGCLAGYLSDKQTNAVPTPQKCKLEDAVNILRSNLKDSLEKDKQILNFSEVKGQLIKICDENGVVVGRSKLKSKHVKRVFARLWPQLKFIPRSGQSDIVCANDMTIEEALLKAVDLENTLHEVREQTDFDASLNDSFVNSEANDVSVLHEAAAILRKRISRTEGLQQEYFTTDELSLENQKQFLDPLLVRFVGWLSSKSKLDDGLDFNEETTDKNVISIASDITTLVKPTLVTPKHLGLTVYLHHTFGSRKLIEDLYSHGYTLSYTEVRHFLTSAAMHLSLNQQQTPSGGIIPPHLVINNNQSHSSDDLLIGVADNWDHNECTLSGKKSTHAMTSILVHTMPNDHETTCRMKRIQERTIDVTALPGNGLHHTLTYNKPSSRPSPHLTPPVDIAEIRKPESKSTQILRMKEVLYNMGRRNFCDDISTKLPPWTVFQTQVQTDSLTKTSEIIFNPIILAPPTDLNTVYTTLVRTKEQMQAIGQKVCPIVFDMGLLTKALEITWAHPTEFEDVVPLEGGMHFLMSVFGGIGHIFGEAGLKQLMVESDVFARLTADHILTGKDFDRALRAIIMIDEVLNNRFLFQLHVWAERNSQLISENLLQKIEALDSYPEDDEGDIGEALSLLDNELVPMIQKFRSEGRSISPLFKFWDDYLTKVSLPIKLFLSASRHGIWESYQDAKIMLLPFLFASNRTVYSRFMTYMVLKMNRLPDLITENFKKGQFVAKLTNGMFNAVWLDYVLEVTENKALKSSGGIIGLTHNDSALTRWFLSRPLTAKYAMAFVNRKDTKSRKHHTDNPSHTNAYNSSVKQMLSLFENEVFIDPFSLSSPPEKLVNMATGIEATPEVEMSLLNCHETGQKLLESFVSERFIAHDDQSPKKSFFDPLPRSKIKTMSLSKSILRTDSKSIKMNAEEMYLRLLAINAFKKMPLQRVLSFENAPVPLSMFTDEGSIMSTKKSDFLEKLEGLLTDESICLVENVDCIVFDAMAIVQILQPPNSGKPTYEQMASNFWRYILHNNKNIQYLHVVFDRYIPNSLKSQTRQKRGETPSSAPVAMQQHMHIGDWKRTLTSGKSKSKLTKLYTEYLTLHCHEILDDNQVVFVAGGFGQKALKVSNISVSFVQDLHSDQEEADVRVLLHVAYASSLGSNNVVVSSPDTDVFVLLVHHFSQLKVDNLYFKTGRKGVHADRTRYIPVHAVVNALKPEERSIMLPIFCLTGCDTCSSFYGIGKKRVFQVMLKSASHLSDLADLGSQPVLLPQTKAAAVKFVGLLYGQGKTTSLNALRTSLVLSKSNVKPRKLPPTDDSFMLHLLRCVYQLLIWRSALSPVALPDPLDFGYIRDVNSGRYIPHMMTKEAAAPELLSNLACTCNNSCEGGCICSINEQPCTEACDCKGFVVDKSVCHNLFTILAAVEFDDQFSEDILTG